MSVDESGDNRFATQIDSDCSGWRLQFALPADSREFRVFDQKRRILNGRAAIACNESSAFVQSDACGRSAPLLTGLGNTDSREEQRSDHEWRQPRHVI